MRKISEQLRDFITRHIFSLEQLEILLLLRGEPDAEWDAASVAKALALQPDSAAARLADLRARGLIDEIADNPLRYRYGASKPIVDELAEAYRTQRVSITTLIFSKPLENIRSFAAAFKLKKDD